MKLLVGLGNPGAQYTKNRHNVGFMFLDTLDRDVVWREEKKFHGMVAEMKRDDEKYVLLKPDTFMNDSGKAVVAVANFYKINVSDIYVIHDDLDISFGSWKIQQSKGPKVHNGITSIEQSIGSIDFWRVRIGVDGRDSQNRMEGHSYVLQDFTKGEGDDLREKVFTEVESELKKTSFK